MLDMWHLTITLKSLAVSSLADLQTLSQMTIHSEVLSVPDPSGSESKEHTSITFQMAWRRLVTALTVGIPRPQTWAQGLSRHSSLLSMSLPCQLESGISTPTEASSGISMEL